MSSDRMIRRWQAYAKDDAVLAGTGERFDDLVAARPEPDESGLVATPEHPTSHEPAASIQGAPR